MPREINSKEEAIRFILKSEADLFTKQTMIDIVNKMTFNPAEKFIGDFSRLSKAIEDNSIYLDAMAYRRLKAEGLV